MFYIDTNHFAFSFFSFYARWDERANFFELCLVFSLLWFFYGFIDTPLFFFWIYCPPFFKYLLSMFFFGFLFIGCKYSEDPTEYFDDYPKSCVDLFFIRIAKSLWTELLPFEKESFLFETFFTGSICWYFAESSNRVWNLL